MSSRRGPGRGLSLGVLLLGYNLLSVGFKHIPPVTLIATLLQSLLYLNYISPPWGNDVCISAYNVLVLQDYKKILISAIEHGSDMHLYYNMSSFLLKGRSLEKRFGSRRFLVLLLVLTVACGICYVGLLECAARYIHPKYRNECAIGFSGVLFALKVLTTHFDSRGYDSSRSVSMFYFYSITVPTRYAVWAELIIIHFLVPNSSFAGHLAGILVGLAYIGGPLEVVVSVIDSVVDGVLSIFGFSSYPRSRGGYFSNRTSYTYTRENVGGRGRRRQMDDFDDDVPPQASYAESEDNYHQYSREDFVPPRSFRQSTRRENVRQDNVGWSNPVHYNQPTAPPLDEERIELNPEQLREQRLRRFQRL